MRKRLIWLAPLLLAVALCCGCSVSEMTSLKEFSRSYTGVYECQTLTYGGRDLLGGCEYVRLTLGYDGEAELTWRRGGRENARALRYTAEPDEGRITLSCGRRSQTFPLEEGRIVMRFPAAGRLLYAEFAR